MGLRRLCIECHALGGYAAGLARQQICGAQVAGGTADDTLLLLEHLPVITTGRHTGLTHLRVSADELARRGVELISTNRGGDITYHGPGQLVGYPIVALQPGERDVRAYVRCLEEMLIRTAADFGVVGRRVDGLRGVWVGNNKLAAIGVRLSRWVTSHGFAFNIDTDLAGFELIVPCGLTGRGVTSLAQQCRSTPSRQAVEASLVGHAAQVLNRQVYMACATAQAPGPVEPATAKVQADNTAQRSSQ